MISKPADSNHDRDRGRGSPGGDDPVDSQSGVQKKDAELSRPILIADDDPVSLRLLEAILHKWGYSVVKARDGQEALALWASEDIRLLVVDWMMPGIDGVEVCRSIRRQKGRSYTYLILLTSRQEKGDVVKGLRAGADDYLIKPFDPQEFEVRLNVGLRVLELEDQLAGRIADLEEAMATIKTIEGLLPICAYCHKIRDDNDYWTKVETYLQHRTNVRFSHGICPDCYEKLMSEEEEEAEDN